MCRIKRKLQTFADFAESIGQLSTCRRRSVGCLIYDPEFTAIHSIGYNGQPAGLPNSGCTGESKNCGCVHAEANALLKLRTAATGLTLLTTVSPCLMCASLITNSKQIANVQYLETYSDAVGLELLRRAGIGTYQIVKETQTNDQS